MAPKADKKAASSTDPSYEYKPDEIVRGCSPFRPGGNCPLKPRERCRLGVLARTVVHRVMSARCDPSADFALVSCRQVLAKVKGYAAWPAHVGRTPPLDLRALALVAGTSGDMITVLVFCRHPLPARVQAVHRKPHSNRPRSHLHCHRARSDALTRHCRMASCCNLCRWSARTPTTCPRPSSRTVVARTPSSCSSSRPVTCASRSSSAWRTSTPNRRSRSRPRGN